MQKIIKQIEFESQPLNYFPLSVFDVDKSRSSLEDCLISFNSLFHVALSTFPSLIDNASSNNFTQEKEDFGDILSNVKIFVLASKDLLNNSKFLEGALTRVEDSGLWIYEISSVVFNPDDNMEYWYYVEHHGLGYFSNQLNANAGGEKSFVKNF